MRYYYEATAVDGITIAESHANAFNSACLDYIPGSSIMGALAVRMYMDASIDGELLNKLFQTNSSIFSNAYPLSSGEMTLPVPMSFHYEKDAIPSKENYENKCVKTDDDKNKQYKQLRNDFVTPDVNCYRVPRHSITRTAINEQRQTAEDQTLHSQEYIRAGQRFLGFIDVIDNSAGSTEKIITEFLNSTIRVGNSRNTEFGRVKMRLLPKDTVSNNCPPVSYELPIDDTPGNSQEEQKPLLYIWCLSDCEFINTETGMASAVPVFSNLWSLKADIPDLDGVYLPQKSFIRNISIRHFNRKRGGLDSESLLVKKGSILCFKLNKLPTQQLLQDALTSLQSLGVGLNRQYGYGQIVVNPSWIRIRKVSEINKLFTGIVVDNSDENDKKSNKTCYSGFNENLSEWIDICHELAQDKTTDYGLVSDVIKLYHELRKFNGCRDFDIIGPSKTQWKNILNILKECKTKIGGINYVTSCLDKIKENCCGNLGKSVSTENSDKRSTSETDAKQWGTQFMFEGKFDCFALHFINLLENKKDSVTINAMIKQLEKMSRYDLSIQAQLQKLNKEIRE